MANIRNIFILNSFYKENMLVGRMYGKVYFMRLNE